MKHVLAAISGAISRLTTGGAPSHPIAKQITLDLGNDVSMDLTLIPAGKFVMGSPYSEANRYPEEGPQQEVRISKPFYMGIHEVTQSQWRTLMGTSISEQRDKASSDYSLYGAGDKHPMYYVSWEDATDFCNKLSAKTGYAIRLPSEAEWEYACRAGTNTPFHFGHAISHDRANYGDFHGETTVVGSYDPNDFGLYDMHGNVSEWCADWYDETYYTKENKLDPRGPDSGCSRVMRSGSFSGIWWFCRSANRLKDGPGLRGSGVGFRVVAAA